MPGLPVADVSKLTKPLITDYPESVSNHLDEEFGDGRELPARRVTDTLCLQRARYKRGQICQGQWWSAPRAASGVA